MTLFLFVEIIQMQIKATHLLSSELSPSQVLHVYLKSPIHPAGIKSCFESGLNRSVKISYMQPVNTIRKKKIGPPFLLLINNNAYVENLSLRGKVFGKKINKFLSLKIRAKLVFRQFTKLKEVFVYFKNNSFRSRWSLKKTLGYVMSLYGNRNY